MTSRVSKRIYFDSDDLPNNIREGAGRLYVIAKGQDGRLIKVGVAMNPRKRVKGLECANGERFPAIWVSPLCTNYLRVEGIMHDLMRTYRAEAGEWFHVPFKIAVAMALQRKYEVVSRYRMVSDLAEAAANVKPPA